MGWISRIRITGGFLAGLDWSLAPGLNVVVGPRGAGKTTLLELLRHALALNSNSDSGHREAFLRHALGSGEIVVDIRFEASATRLVVDANGGGRQSAITTDLALMLGQNELEAIADSAARRLALIDTRARIAVKDQEDIAEALRSLTLEIFRMRRLQEDLRDLLRRKATLLEDRQRLADRENELLSRTGGSLAPQRERLADLERLLLEVQTQLRGASQLRQAEAVVVEALDPLRGRLADLSVVTLEPSIRAEVHESLDAARELLEIVTRTARSVSSIAQASAERLRQHDVVLRAEAEPVRSELERTEKGLGAVTGELRDINVQLAQLDSIEQDLTLLEDRVTMLVSERKSVQDQLENASEKLYSARDAAARLITEQLDHRVQITVRHMADTAIYKRTLADLLQGSGLRHNLVSEALATNVLPSRLLGFVERGDTRGLSNAADFALDRSTRVLSALNNEAALQQISTLVLNDSVDFRLQDGAVLKSVAQLSTGQKCAVTMPIVLTDPARVVILDQPEDHLDNQYLVDRVITSIIQRSQSGAQTIVATHNPNIPVLGEARQVGSLASDGTHGTITAAGSFDSPQIVRVVTTLMEGGRAAFNRRASFYNSHLPGSR